MNWAGPTPSSAPRTAPRTPIRWQQRSSGRPWRRVRGALRSRRIDWAASSWSRPSLGAWVLAEPQSLTWLPWPPVAWRQTLGDLAPSQIGPLAFGTWRSWIAGVLVLAILIYSVAIIGRLVAHWWAWRQREPSDLVVSTVPPVRRRPPVQPSGADGTSRQGLA